MSALVKACIAIFVGFVVGSLAPLSALERKRLAPLATRSTARFKTGFRAFTDRSIVAGLGRR